MTSSRESHFTPGETEARDLTEHLPEVRVQPGFASSSQHSLLGASMCGLQGLCLWGHFSQTQAEGSPNPDLVTEY